MTKIKSCLGTTLALVLLIPATAATAKPERKLTAADLPKPVLARVNAKYPGAKLKGFDDEGEATKSGLKIYEVELDHQNATVSIDLAADGKILAEETTMAPEALPAAVKTSLDGSKYKRWKILKAERVITEEKTEAPAFEVIVERQDAGKHKRFEVVLDQAGKITKEEAKSAADND